MKLVSITDSELEIMLKIWELNVPVTSSLLVSEFWSDKEWKPQTVSTFLSRLVKKQYLAVEKYGASNVYTPLISKEEYEHLNAECFIKNRYNGSVKKLLSSLIDCGYIDNNEIEELKDWFNRM